MGQYIHGQTLIQAFENWAPKKLAFENDKIGLQIGTLNKKVKKVMVTLDVLENVADEAIEKNVDLIFAHHAVIFRPLKDIRADSGQGKIISKLIQNDIAVYVAHTNLDVAEGGINDMLAQKLGLTNSQILKPTYTEPLYKLSVFVPESHAAQVREALGSAGAGAIGNYSHCTFNIQGTGTFLPEEGTNPYIGEKGKLEQVSEVRVETIVPESLLNRTVNKMISSHPYEEVAYDVYPLDNQGKTFGLGRIGELPEAVTLKELAENVKERLDLDGVRVTGDLDSKVKKIAVSGGDGNSLIPFAKYKGADVIITGDVYYHTAHDALLHQLNVIDAGHHIEKVVKEGAKQYFEEVIQSSGCYDTTVIASSANTNPFIFI
ncbi:dinuclear metal center YbgI/SA1388 family protein [Scopulibacillus daqui]|uniref:GTP cyclohydrolase 1 type 2 homolog n=1 Tax=Scopulibacillus daqui TaxID=1469162 RepID=A0ABS2Q0G0_9BACL|nr:Nif3-like dinuclear metal center hexameric protein [Scopulibacillus daqui]MBM7645782.1 dinuclear metal center YbgI/SA1388 family protein [Scopulibacillus daqui]